MTGPSSLPTGPDVAEPQTWTPTDGPMCKADGPVARSGGRPWCHLPEGHDEGHQSAGRTEWPR